MQYLQLFYKIAKVVHINAHLVISICTIESNLTNTNNFNDRLAPSLGICQLHLETAREQIPYIDSLALQQPQVNILVAAKYLKKQLKRYDGNIEHAIAAYNYGSVKIVKGEYINNNYVDNVLLVLYTKMEGK